MRFTVITCGTEGDTRPLIGICRGLLDSGHQVQFFGDCSTLYIAEKEGVPSKALKGDIKAVFDSGKVFSKNSENGGGKAVHTAKILAQIANENTSSWMKEVSEDAKLSQAILFSGISSYVGLSIAESLNIHGIGLALIPISPTNTFPSPLLPYRKIPKFLNKISHKIINSVFWSLFRNKVNKARKDVFFKVPRKKMWTEYPILYGVSKYLLPEPTDWKENFKLCGAWTTKTQNWEAPQDLLDFLASGPPPIYIGFGSMGGFDSEKIISTIVKSVNGRRVLFYSGWSGIEANSLPDNFFFVGATPHDWLFPQTSMVIHHGGAGTTHTASRAGVPSVVIPFGGDQFFWAQRLYELGVAPSFVPHTKIDSTSLSAMISFAEKKEVIEQAKKLGEKMSKENGIEYAIKCIEDLVSKPISLC